MNLITKLHNVLKDFHERLKDGPVKEELGTIINDARMAELEARLIESQIAFNLSHAELNNLEIGRLKEPHYRAALDRRIYLDKQIAESHEELIRLKKEIQRLNHESQRLRKLNEEMKWNKAPIKPPQYKSSPRATIGDAVEAKKLEAAKTAAATKEQPKKIVEEVVELKNPVEDANKVGTMSDEELEKITRPAGYIETTV